MQTEYDRTQPWVLPALAGRRTCANTAKDDWLIELVSAPDTEIRNELVARGFDFAEGLNAGMSRSLRAAATMLREVRLLEISIWDCVTQIVPLVAEPDYDISHSEPRWDSLIFLTIPEDEGHRAALRSLENIVHEAMHVQLTRLEHQIPLIANETAMMSSPWRDHPRYLRGVLHGAYVFVCIRACLMQLSDNIQLDEGGRRYTSSRIAQINDEIGSIDMNRLSMGLTGEGERLVRQLLAAN
ncbi:HEXXH motif-containing putative peptide modification protein [Bradyrhizobium sp. BEA-2-5]|uniref:aKG-HExxH-type peptide beta-hydroxylase n=1 Tax=Bradyrhizobium sp. BEA-2-5 TaxID=3080015 RepID=UPI00293F2433|nr:HEXXH motif-containing putative peptide modification protein [Bradyrhizobium sp. BEA-2-5]WOH82136.1 HEXXH motif-containing putative peptide modification protein [Bradyrhizobium sp. BEA-2-5]